MEVTETVLCFSHYSYETYTYVEKEFTPLCALMSRYSVILCAVSNAQHTV